MPGASASGQALGNGLANLHNARKAQSPMVNIIGNHATTHQRFDAPLTSDVAAFAKTVSHWVALPADRKTVAADTGRGVQAARTASGQIASLILPADAAWLIPGVGRSCSRCRSDAFDPAFLMLARHPMGRERFETRKRAPRSPGPR